MSFSQRMLAFLLNQHLGCAFHSYRHCTSASFRLQPQRFTAMACAKFLGYSIETDPDTPTQRRRCAGSIRLWTEARDETGVNFPGSRVSLLSLPVPFPY